MHPIWQSNIRKCREIIQQNAGPMLVNIVSGQKADQDYWLEHLQETRRDIFRADEASRIVSSLERTRKGNFLGTLNAWTSMNADTKVEALPPMVLMSMVFGMGKRLSPFTQALSNRKPAFPTPMCSSSGKAYLATADIASMSATLWLHHLESHGFRGVIVKWGDEAVIPGKNWDIEQQEYADVDAVRFVWQTEPTEDLAREKEWVEFDARSAQMTFQYTRQDLDSLRQRLAQTGQERLIGVNLGSLAISYRLIQVAQEVFREDIDDDSRWVDWDPYTWIAISCENAAQWNAEATRERQMGKTGISDLEKRFPDFFTKIQAMCHIFQQRHGRFPVVKVLDFGQPYWMDWGLHLSLRRSLEALPTESPSGETIRELFYLPLEFDRHSNIILRSSIPSEADIHHSVIIDSTITDPHTVIHGGVVVAGRHRQLVMPEGGCALFCAVDRLSFAGAHAIAFKVIDREVVLKEGDRLANLFLASGKLPMRTNESILNYEGENYSSPVMGNSISFEEAARRMSLEDTRLVEKRWYDQWSDWTG